MDEQADGQMEGQAEAVCGVELIVSWSRALTTCACRYNGKVLLSSDRAFSWRVKGNKVPPPVVLSLQILYYQQNAKHK
jgi:hypothetical protein